MYTDEQAKRAHDILETLPPDKAAIVQQRLDEYDAARAGAAPNEHVAQPEPSIADFQSTEPNPDLDANLPNASKQKRFAAPPEYVSKKPGASLSLIAKSTLVDPLDGPTVTSFFEPPEKQFQSEMGPVLKAKGIAPGSDEYGVALAEYRDRKWEQAYQQAAAEDRPLMRVAYINQGGRASGWDKLSAYLAERSDEASAFAKGFASGGTMGLTRTLSTNADVEQEGRQPVAGGAGEFAGAVNPRSLANKLAGGIGKAATPRLGRYGASAMAGGVGAGADVASHAGAQALGDQLHGRPLDEDAKSHFAARLLGGALLGTGAGVFGEGIASAAQRYRTGLRSATSDIGPELTNAESTGTATDALSGLSPSSDVKKYLDKARGPVPGEDHAAPTGSAVEYAAADVRNPVVAQQETEHAAALKRMEEESGRAIATDPKLSQPQRMTELGRALRKVVLERSQPEAAGQFLPGVDDALGARNNSQFIKFVRDIYKPRLVLGVDAAKEAGRHGGEVVSLEDAKRMGFKVQGLESELNPSTGLPHDAPSLSGGDSMPWHPQANPVEVLPKYSKDALLAHADELGTHPPATPEQAAALNKWSFGHDEAIRGVQRGDPDAAIIQKRLETYGGPVDKMGVPHEQHLAEAKDAARHIEEYLAATPPTTKLPFVYRGLVLSREEAKKFLQQGEFDLGKSASSVSADPTVARSFLQRNRQDGDVGIVLKLEHNSARDISPYAADRVKIEKELLVPGNSKFESTARYEDASNPGDYIVTGKQKIPSDPNATQPEIDATIHPRDSELMPDLTVPQHMPAKEFQVVLEPRAYDAAKMEQQIHAIDQAGKAGTEAKVDPAWPELMRAARVDREQFGKAWSGLKSVHHDELTALEQRAAHAGITERNLYPEMSGNAQKTANSALTNYGVAPQETNKALGELADNAGVRPNLETLKGVRAYSALKEKAAPKLTEGLTSGGNFTRVGGLLPGMKLRGDALARSFTRGPEGAPLFVEGANRLPGEPIAREYASAGPFSNLLSMGRGALGVKTGSVYDSATGRAGPGNTLSPEERAKLESMLGNQ